MSKSAFFIGIKGVGMTSLAIAMQEAGWQVAGSDTEEEFITDEVLLAHNIPVSPLSTPLPPAERVIYSAAYLPPEGLTNTGEPSNALPLAQALAEFVQNRQVVAVAGVGGKTTISAMLASLFHAAGRDVGYYLGTSHVAGLAGPGHSGTDQVFVVEADEYVISRTDKRPKFALLDPHILVTTNIVHDHPDVYHDEEATLEAFSNLVHGLKESSTWIYNPADPLTQKILFTPPRCKLIPYKRGVIKPSLAVFGEQNELDAVAAVLAAEASGVERAKAQKAIESYKGCGRRQESRGEAGGRLLYDDYGHHPEEIAVTLKSFKAHFPERRLLVVFESHTYSRTESLLQEFAKALSLADIPFIMPIFESAREKGKAHSITPESFREEVAKYNPHAKALTWDNAAEVVAKNSRQGDVILTMGAGFVYKLHDKIKALLN